MTLIEGARYTIMTAHGWTADVMTPDGLWASQHGFRTEEAALEWAKAEIADYYERQEQ